MFQFSPRQNFLKGQKVIPRFSSRISGDEIVYLEKMLIPAIARRASMQKHLAERSAMALALAKRQLETLKNKVAA